MDTREIAVEYRLAHWAQIMQERMSSGKTIREFCASAGYKEHVYYYWQRKLRETACKELVPAEPDKRREAGVPEGWMVCASGGAKANPAALTIEIGGYKVLVESDMDAELLKKVCRALASIC